MNACAEPAIVIIVVIQLKKPQANSTPHDFRDQIHKDS